MAPSAQRACRQAFRASRTAHFVADPEKLARSRALLHKWRPDPCLVKEHAVTTPLALDRTHKALASLEAPIARAIASARTRDIDEQQVAVARLTEIATKLRAAQDLATYAATAGAIYQEQAAVFAGYVTSEVGRLVRDFGRRARAHGGGHAERGDAGLRARGAVRRARARDRPRGRAERGGTTDRSTRCSSRCATSVREFAEQRGRAARRAHPPPRRADPRGVHHEDGRARLLRALGARGSTAATRWATSR